MSTGSSAIHLVSYLAFLLLERQALGGRKYPAGNLLARGQPHVAPGLPLATQLHGKEL